MALAWQIRGDGPLEHVAAALTLEQSAALAAPTAPGVQAVTVEGEVAWAIAVPTPRREGRPLLWGPAVYATRDDAETHAEAWLARDRDAFYALREAAP